MYFNAIIFGTNILDSFIQLARTITAEIIDMLLHSLLIQNENIKEANLTLIRNCCFLHSVS